jgi:16S rRNA (uracil1498-N3)-methyltransferase
MPCYDFRTTRLYIDAPLADAANVMLDADQSHYLTRVLRLKDGQEILIFNGRDGEWRATLEGGTQQTVLRVSTRTRLQTAAADLHYLFAPLKSARLDYMVQKAVEMGVSQLRPVLTQHGQVARVNLHRIRANAIEAAEQCGILCLPEIAAPVPLAHALGAWQPERHLVFCDEAADVADPFAALVAVPRHAPLAVLIGPEGGFAADERAALLKLPHVVRLALGPRILRADTAAVAALALIQAIIGDWR